MATLAVYVSFEVKRRSIFCVGSPCGGWQIRVPGRTCHRPRPGVPLPLPIPVLHQAAKCPRDGDSGDHALLGGGERIL